MAFRGSDSHGQGPFTTGACAKRSFKPHLHETHVGAARYLSSPDLCVSKLGPAKFVRRTEQVQ